MDWRKTLTDFWAARATRERQFLASGGILLALALLYAILVAPALDGIASLQRQLPVARARAARLETLIAEAKSLRALPQTAMLAPAEARASIDKSIESAGLKSPRTEALPNGDLRMTFTDVSYAKWTGWLAATERTMGVRVVAAHVKASSSGAPGSAGAGHTDIELTLHLLRAG